MARRGYFDPERFRTEPGPDAQSNRETLAAVAGDMLNPTLRARLAGVTKPALVVTRMIDRGLIERVPAPGRAVRHRLTERGEQAREEGRRLLQAVLEESFRPFDDQERAQFGALLARLLDP